MTIDAFLHMLHELPLAMAIREGDNLFPWIESLHVLCIVIVVGTIGIVDLRLIGMPSHKRSVRKLILELLPFTWAAFAPAAVFGSLLFISNAVTYAHNADFPRKMICMVLAGVNMGFFHFITQRNMHLWDELTTTPAAAKIAGFSSLILWVGVIFFGRWVGFTLA